jgi:hypothetical protein
MSVPGNYGSSHDSNYSLLSGRNTLRTLMTFKKNWPFDFNGHFLGPLNQNTTIAA